MAEDLFDRIKSDYPDLKFISGKKFAFRPPRTIVVGPDELWSDLLLLHELGHATLGHRDYAVHIDRLRMESEAWERARELAEKYGVEFDDGLAQDELDTYRDWLHKKSRCPRCGLTRFQSPDGAYHCPLCENI